MITSHSTLPMRLRCLECIYWFSTTIEALQRRPALALAGPQGTPEALGECVLHLGLCNPHWIREFCKTKRVRIGWTIPALGFNLSLVCVLHGGCASTNSFRDQLSSIYALHIIGFVPGHFTASNVNSTYRATVGPGTMWLVVSSVKFY